MDDDVKDIDPDLILGDDPEEEELEDEDLKETDDLLGDDAEEDADKDDDSEEDF